MKTEMRTVVIYGAGKRCNWLVEGMIEIFYLHGDILDLWISQYNPLFPLNKQIIKMYINKYINK